MLCRRWWPRAWTPQAPPGGADCVAGRVHHPVGPRHCGAGALERGHTQAEVGDTQGLYVHTWIILVSHL